MSEDNVRLLGTEIRRAVSNADYQAFAEIIIQYAGWCRDRYRDDAWFIDEVFGYQALSSELEHLRECYGPPRGATFVAIRHERVYGAGAYRVLPDGSCEMKRLYVPDQFHGMGVGRALCEKIIASARDEGFTKIRLDTGRRFTEAIGLYMRQGFRECEPYSSYPPTLVPYLMFMELDLGTAPSSPSADEQAVK